MKAVNLNNGEIQMQKKNELVYSFLDKRYVMAIRQSNCTILLKKRPKIIDSDRMMLTDKRGHRYCRLISMENLCKGFYYFQII